MPIKVPDNLPALEDLLAEQVDVMAQKQALRQDIRPLRLLLLNLMPKKQETEIQFARLFGNSPLQIELILMTTASYTPRHTEPAYLRRFYRRLEDVKDEFFDALIVTGAPIERLPFEEVAYWEELTQIMDWSRTHCFRRLGICWGAQALLYHFHGVLKHDCGDKLFGVFRHELKHVPGRLMRGFTDNFPMPVSRYTENRRAELEAAGIEVLAESEVFKTHCWEKAPVHLKKVSFCWWDSYRPSKRCTQQSFLLEKAGILFNAGALAMQRGLGERARLLEPPVGTCGGD